MPAKRILTAALVIVAWSVPGLAQQRAPAALEKRAGRLQARVENLEAVRAIKRLQSAYGHYTELGLWNDFADLFTDDASTNYQQGAKGRAEVRKLFFDQVGQGKLGLADGRIYPHILFQPVITLASDGRTAKGRWRILAMLGGMGGSATWYSGVYENEYILEGGSWKISVLHSEPKVTAAYTAAGWRDSGAHVPLHFSAASLPSALAGGAVNTSSQPLADRVAELAQRAARLKDQAEVTNALDAYGYAIDAKAWSRAADLFASDGTLELGQQGVYVGKDRIRRALEQTAAGTVNDHVYLQTVVTVAPGGGTAQARGVELVMSGDELSEGIFENTFVKQNGTWKLQEVHFYPRMIVDAALGWAKSAKPAPGPSTNFPPDRPPSALYEIYPKFAVAPFHFDNPVTGKPPQYPAGVSGARTERASAPQASRPTNLERALAEVERSLTAAEAYESTENLLNAYGYYLDESPREAASLFVRPAAIPAPPSSILAHQILQPVIEVAADGKSAKLRARRLDPGGTSGGPGSWTSGSLEGRAVFSAGVWKFETLRSTTSWTAPYPGGWARIQ